MNIFIKWFKLKFIKYNNIKIYFINKNIKLKKFIFNKLNNYIKYIKYKKYKLNQINNFKIYINNKIINKYFYYIKLNIQNKIYLKKLNNVSL